MRFTILATTAFLLQASTTAEAAKRTTSSAAFLDAFEFGRSNHKAKHPSTIQRKRNGHRALIIHDEDTTGESSRRHLAGKTSKADDGDETSSSDANTSKKGNYHLFPKAIKEAVNADAASYSTDVGSIYYVEPVHMAKSAKSAALPKSSKTLRFLTKASKDNLESIYGSMSYPSFTTLGFSMPDDESPSPTEEGGEGTIATASPSVTPPPRDPTPNNFHEVIFKYLSVCTGVELEWDCLTYTTIEAMMAMAGVDATRSRARFLGIETTNGPTPVFERPTPAPAPLTSTPTITSTAASTSTEDQCRPEVNEDDLLSILTTSKQECIDSGTLISDETFQATLAAFTSIFDPTNTCWDTLCNDSDPTSDLFFQILFGQASECAGVELTVEECILDHILEVVFVSNAPDESGTSVRRSLQESCCEPTESDLHFYATYLLLSAEASCAESGSAAITTEEWNKATDDLVKLFGATECWGVDPCDEEDEVVSQEVPTPSPSSNSAISGDVTPFYDGPILSDDGKVCTITPDYDSSAVRSLELSFFYQVETASESLDLGPIERALIAEVCDAAASERRLQDYETEVIAVDASPEDVISDDYTCTPSTSGRNCHVIKGAMTILLTGPISPNEETLFLAKIASLFPIALDDSDMSITYLPTPAASSSSSSTDDDNQSSTTSYSPFGITVAATAVVAAALLARGAANSRRSPTDESPAHPDTGDSPPKALGEEEDGFKGQDELTCAGTAELTCASDDTSPSKHHAHVVNDEEREHWRKLGIIEGTVDL